MRILCLIFALACSILSGCQTTQSSRGNFFSLPANDEAISAAVSETFMNHPDLSKFQFHIETKDGIVYISGYVKTIRQSDTAGDLAGKVPGVKNVENNIVVRK